MSIAKTAKIFPWAKIVAHETSNFSVGDYSQIDDFVFLNVGKKCVIGRFVHLSCFVSIIGGGEFTIGDFSGLSAGCRVITGSDDFRGPYLTNPTVPRELSHYQISHVTIEKHVIIGTNTVIYPGVTIGEGAAVGAGCHVRTSLPPWGLYVGDPLKKIAERDEEAIHKKAKSLLEKLQLGPLEESGAGGLH